MLNQLEQIRKEALQAAPTKSTVRNGSERKGHWRHYQDGHSVYIYPMDVAAHNVTRRK